MTLNKIQRGNIASQMKGPKLQYAIVLACYLKVVVAL
jgi:hypothetical protein